MRRFFNYCHVIPRMAKVNPLVPFLAIQNQYQYYFNAPRDENQRNIEYRNMRNAFLWFFTWGIVLSVAIERGLKKYDSMSLEELTMLLNKELKLENYSAGDLISYVEIVNSAYFHRDFDSHCNEQTCVIGQSVQSHEAFSFFEKKYQAVQSQKSKQSNSTELGGVTAAARAESKSNSLKTEPVGIFNVCSAYSVSDSNSDQKIGTVTSKNEGLIFIADYIKKNPNRMYYKIYDAETKKEVWWGDSWRLQQELREMGSSENHKDIARHNAQAFF